METTETPNPTNALLKNKYELHKATGVNAAALAHQRRTGELVPQDPLARIENFLSLWHERLTPETSGPRTERNLKRVTQVLHNRYIVKPDEIPEGYFENQRRLAREQGHGDIEISPQMRAQLTEVIIADQTSSMDKWIGYLASPDAPYPDALKYWTLRSVLSMGEYDKEKKMYPQRSRGTTKPFPDLNREALAYVIDVVDKKYQGEKHPDPEFAKLLQGENFAKLYAWAIEKITPASEEELAATNGNWVKYDQNSDPMPLVQSLQGHGTNWCTAGESTARTQLQGGDFYVYYSMDKSGKPTVPRAAIRMEGSRIAEVRGIAVEQNLDSGAVAVVEEKLKEFPDGPNYQKRVVDMRRLTNIENQTQEGQSLSAEDLVFLYEIDSQIEGFGFDKDPRIEEIRSKRNPDEDMPIVFGCTREQIAKSAKDINAETKAYVGPLEPGIFDRLLANLEHIYTSFPEGKIRRETVEIGGIDFKQIAKELEGKLNIVDTLTWEKAGEILEQARTGSVQLSSDTIEFLSQLFERQINVSGYALDMVKNPEFTTSPTPTKKDTVGLSVKALGLTGTPTTDQVYVRADELGLELCPAEVGLHKRIQNTKQPMRDWEYIAMKTISGRNGDPDVFELGRNGDGLWLFDNWAKPGYRWNPGNVLVFCLRK